MRFFCFKQLPLNIEQNFEFSYQSIDGKRILSVVVRILKLSSDKPSDFHDTNFSVLLSLFKE